ncbi:hypothetical protein D5F01_LYC06251 [Larimichthys crocea]|uniref:Sushi, von Willebrand factor type A, EGF and pentraxin domain-containing protein 1 n=1 Tax=Larimichthys crocea TaxID=215358 RepID=A0A6G0IUX8_LARCR|nr:hypothetical protein D5F01_LYC06251 [Larimichthys crocea]
MRDTLGSSGLGLPCARGRYCPAGLEEVTCPRGTFTPHEGAISVKDCLKCPAGYYCPAGTRDPVPCPPGSFNPLEGQDELADCRECYAGKACTQVALKAPDCGLHARYKCPVGTWSGQSGLEAERECRPCPKGWYCLAGSGSPSGRCSSGHYCPEGTAYGTQFPCPAGTYSMQMGNRYKEDCLLCPEGSFCQQGTSKPSPCPPSTFRHLKGGRRLEDCSVCPAGYFCPHSATVNPRVCGAGSYSDEGSLECSPCLQGHYCSNETTSEEAMLSVMVCPPGFLCSQGLARDPQRSATLCPRGSIPIPVPCPNGTYSETPGLRDASECIQCPEGKYCYSEQPLEQPITGPGQGTPTPTPVCLVDIGTTHLVTVEKPVCYVHPGITATDWGLTCPQSALGAFTVQKAVLLLNRVLKEPSVHAQLSVMGLSAPLVVEACIAPVWDSQSHLEAAKSASTVDKEPSLQALTRINLVAILWSTVGHVKQAGSAAELASRALRVFVTRDITAPLEPPLPLQSYTEKEYGYSHLLQVAVASGGVCSAGYVCPRGTMHPQQNPCPVGTWSSMMGAQNLSSCWPCPPGHYCNSTGLSQPSGICDTGFFCDDWGLFEPTGLCQAGYYCIAGSEGGLCPSAHYCPEGSASPMPCPAGTYTNLTGQSVCSSCPAGYYCAEMTGNFNKFPCPPGFYCPDGTRHATQFPCPRGYYNPEPMTQSLDSCLPCPPGHYCEKERLTKVSGKCKAGWFCVSAAWNSQPFDLDNYTNANCLCPATSTGGRCQVGFYCPLGSQEPLPCPPGAFCNISVEGSAEPELCPAGTFSALSGLTSETRYYCVEGATTSTPTDGITGGPCPEGSYCPKGAVRPVPCDPGTYVAVTHATQCEPCLPGWYCVSGSLYLCPAGFYCPEGTGFDLRGCPEGTYGPDPGYWSVSQCRQCDGGHYCSSRNGTAITGPCQGGYYCSHGNKSPQPFSQAAGEGGPCPAGHYCPEATVHPLPCPPGTFSNLTKLVSQEDCQPCLPGYYCDAVGALSTFRKMLERFLLSGGSKST